MKNIRFLNWLAVILCVYLTACVSQIEATGYTFDEEELVKVIPGETTKSGVFRLLGSPSFLSSLDSEIWYYTAGEYKRKAFFTPKLTKQRVVAFVFNGDVVDEIRHYDEHNAQDIAINSEKTVTEGHDLSLVNQLLGNIGRFNTKSDDHNPGGI